MQITGPRTGNNKEGQNKTKYQSSHAKRIMAPQTLDQSGGDKVSGPDWSDKLDYGKGIMGLMEKISSQQVSAQVKIKVMQRAMATCPKVNMGGGRKMIPSLLDSGSQVTLIHQSFLEQEILPHMQPSDGEKAEALQLTAANHGKLPISMYVDLDFLGIVVPKVGVLITKSPMNFWMHATKPNCLV